MKEPYSPYYNKGMTGWLRLINYILWPSLFFWSLDLSIWCSLLLPVVLIIWAIFEIHIYAWDERN